MTRLLRFFALLTGLLVVLAPAARAQGLTFTFANAQLTTGGTRYEYDVVITPDAGATGLRLGDTQTYINYNTTGFGSSVAGTSTVTLGSALQANGLYAVTNVANNTASKLSVTLTYNGATGTGVALPAGQTTLFHISMPVANAASTAGISFDQALMANEQFRDDFTRFTPITATDAINGNLPVELTGFAASTDGRAVVLSWATQSETNNAGFAVEARRSEDAAGAWRELKFVEGRGTTSEAARYSFRADNMTPGRYNFRLRQVDFDGAASYSPTVEVTVEAARVLALSEPSPNPVRTGTTLSFTVPTSGHATLGVYDMLGREVSRLFDGEAEAGREHRARFAPENLGAGVYVVRLTNGAGVLTRTLTVVK